MVNLLERLKRFGGELLHQDADNSALIRNAYSGSSDELAEARSSLARDPIETRKVETTRYLFAYWVLPQFFFEQAEAFYSSLVEDEAVVLRYTWRQLCARRREQPTQQDLDTLALQFTRVLERRCAWITLPAPVDAGEPYYTAVIGKDAVGDGWRYFALEKVLSTSGEPAGLLCERLPDGSSRYHGHISIPGLEAFQELLRKHLLRERLRKSVAEQPALDHDGDIDEEDDTEDPALQPASIHGQIRWAP